VRRRSDIGVVRALGMTRQMVLSAFIAEALFFGSVGSLLGIAVGRLMANGAVLMVNGTVQSLYVTSRAAPLTLSLDALISGVGLGLLVSLLAALPPAFEAAQVPPIEAMAHGRIEFVVGTRWPVTLPAIFVCAALAALLAKLPPVHRQPFFGYLSVLFLITATAIATPAAVVLFTRLASRITAKLLQVEGLLAARSLRASLGRTSILTAALTTAIAMTASVGIMVGSFRTTLVVWMNDQLKADLYLRPAAIPGADRYPTMAPTIIDRLQQLPFIAALDLFRSYPIVYDGLPANLAGGNSNRISSLPIEDKLSGEDRESITRQLASGDYALVSEPFASKHDVHPGSVLTLPLAGTNRPFKVLAVYYDYSTERGLIMLDRKTLLRYLPDPALSSAAIYLKPGVDRQYARRLINELLGGSAVFIADNAALRRAALQIVDNTFRITYALEAVAIFVAVMGVAGALLSLVIDRKRELALLRFLGAAKIQIRRIILCEAALLGLLATLLGLILGSLLSLILIFVINKQSFGWTLQFHVPVGMLTAVLISVYAATLMAALYPSHIAMRLNPVEVIHEE
jgi:putative ABC transport system permease protein